jgi:hypothetical protein
MGWKGKRWVHLEACTPQVEGKVCINAGLKQGRLYLVDCKAQILVGRILIKAPRIMFQRNFPTHNNLRPSHLITSMISTIKPSPNHQTIHLTMWGSRTLVAVSICVITILNTLQRLYTLPTSCDTHHARGCEPLHNTFPRCAGMGSLQGFTKDPLVVVGTLLAEYWAMSPSALSSHTYTSFT